MKLCKAPDNCRASDVVGKVKCCLVGPQWEEDGGKFVDGRDCAREKCAWCGLTEGHA